MDGLSLAPSILEQFTKQIEQIRSIKRRSSGQKIELDELLRNVTKNKDDTKQMIDDIGKSNNVLNSEGQAALEEKLKVKKG